MAAPLLVPGSTKANSRNRISGQIAPMRMRMQPTTAVPTAAAWQLGWHSASLLVERYAQEHGSYPKRLALSAWGTANMRTGGDDIAQALALLGVRPVWETASGRSIHAWQDPSEFIRDAAFLYDLPRRQRLCGENASVLSSIEPSEPVGSGHLLGIAPATRF